MANPAGFLCIMNDLLPRPWDAIAYALVLLVSLGSLFAVVFFISSHCEWVFQETGVDGACGLGIGWVVVELIFLGIAGYAAFQLYDSWKESAGGL
jgi:hypothetical protein